MKSYEQMANDVLRRVEDRRRQRIQRRRTLGRSAVAVSGALLVVLAGVWCALPFGDNGGSGDSLVLQSPAPKASSQLQVSYVSEDGWTVEEMKTQIETEMRYTLFVTDIRHLSAEEKEQLFDTAETQLVTKMESLGIPATADKNMMLSYAWDNAIFALVRGGGFRLALDEKKSVKSISAACRSGYGEAEFGIYAPGLDGQEITHRVGWHDAGEMVISKKVNGSMAWLHAGKVALEGEAAKTVIEETAGDKGRLYICWRPSSELYEALNAKPDRPLSDFSDTMTVAVTYTDDTLEIHDMDIVFHDDGTISAVYRGATVVK